MNPLDVFTVHVTGPHGDTFTWISIDPHTATALFDLCGNPNTSHIVSRPQRHGDPT